MRKLRASELAAFSYCQRAWWYQNQGYPSENQTQLTGGTQFHRAHAANLWQARWLRLAAAAAAILALVLALLKVLL